MESGLKGLGLGIQGKVCDLSSSFEVDGGHTLESAVWDLPAAAF